MNLFAAPLLSYGFQALSNSGIGSTVLKKGLDWLGSTNIGSTLLKGVNALAGNDTVQSLAKELVKPAAERNFNRIGEQFIDNQINNAKRRWAPPAIQNIPQQKMYRRPAPQIQRRIAPSRRNENTWMQDNLLDSDGEDEYTDNRYVPASYKDPREDMFDRRVSANHYYNQNYDDEDDDDPQYQPAAKRIRY